MTLEPVLLALVSSACFGLALVVTQLGLRRLPAADGALVSIPTMTLLFWALSPFVLDLGGWQAYAAAIFALVGLFFPAAVTLPTRRTSAWVRRSPARSAAPRPCSPPPPRSCSWESA